MSQRIAIIGAGIGGLTLAIDLQRKGLDVRIYEQTAVLREVGAAVPPPRPGCEPVHRGRDRPIRPTLQHDRLGPCACRARAASSFPYPQDRGRVRHRG
ncbi:NAD(P)-binding protein [Kocuria sp. ICS0012]|uniref:NAD(P)-binding protein n=1 Tax=Kocuria sp. ICS0012 TaxID=1834155 RepID=UPI0009EE30E1